MRSSRSASTCRCGCGCGSISSSTITARPDSGRPHPMTLEALLSYAHILAILTAVVFISSETALCRIEWMNERVVERLVTVNRIYLVGLVLVLVTGLARIAWGMKGAGWYWGNGLLHLKLALFVVVIVLAIKPAALYRRWR